MLGRNVTPYYADRTERIVSTLSHPRNPCFTIPFLVVVVLVAFCVHGAFGAPSLRASAAFDRWVAQQRGLAARAFTDPQAVSSGLALAQGREQEMRALIQGDPQQFVSLAMPESERAQLPAQIQSHIEQRLKGRGFFGVYCAGLPIPGSAPASEHGGYAYEVQLNGTHYKAFAFGKWKDQKTVYDAQIEGVALGDAIAVGDSATPTEQAAAGQSVSAYTPTTTGPNTLLYIIAQYSDQTNAYPISDSEAFADTTVISNFWMNCSYGRVYLHGLTNSSQVMDIVHITLPQPSSYAATYNNNFAQLLSDARNAASAQGFNYASYNLDVVVTTLSGYGYAGYSYIGAQGSHWCYPYVTLRTGGHELGHNLGLYHANYWRTDSTLPFGKDSDPGGYVGTNAVNAEWVEYGHYFSVMSAQYGGEWDDATKPIYNPVEKVQLGWLSGSQVQYVSASGTYRLFRDDARTTVGTPRGIRIETPATDYTGYSRHYWLGYRYAPWNTAQSWYQNGVQVDVCQTSYGSDGSIQLDMTPYSHDEPSPFYDSSNPTASGNWWTIDNSDKVDGALIVGRSYDDAPAGIHITPIDTGNNGAGEEYIDVVINLGTFAGDHPPVISSFTAATNQVATGQPVIFNVSASDPDSDTLAYSWEFGDVQVWNASGLNSPTATKSWSSPGQYRVQVRVSDMKGGVTTASQIINVGAAPSTNQIWGRVLWGGRPVYGARIWTNSWAGYSSAQAWTDSDGSYPLAGLPPIGYTVNCMAAGLTFTAQFTNPVSLSLGNAYGIDFYANQPLQGAGGASFSVSGQVTDPINGAAGAEVRGGGMVATTDTGGNFSLSNFVNGTYTLTPRNGAWTFSPANRSVTINSANSTGNNFSRVAPNSISGSFSGIPTGHGSSAPTVYLSNGRSVSATGGNMSKGTWNYTLNSVPTGQYSVSAELPGYSLVPSGFSNPLTVSGSMTAINFIGSTGTVWPITGRITQSGLPLAGVTVQANQGSSTIGTAFSDSDGYYRIENLPSGSYTVVPNLTGYTLSPSTQNVSGIPASGINFTATGPSAPPAISSLTANPSTVSSSAGTTTLSVIASGGTLTYSWDALSAAAPVAFSTNDSSAAASTTVSFLAPGSYTFRSRVTGTNGLPATATVNVTVSAGPGSIVVSPYEVQTPGGQNVSFRADAWDQLGNRISVSPSWSVSGGGTIDSNGLFSATVMGGPFSVIATASGLSATGLVWVTTPATPVAPMITSQPTNQTDVAGSNATFSAIVSGTAPLVYQWLFNSNSIPGATNSSYTRMGVQPSDAGSYSVQVTNLVGATTSSNAMLTVIIPPAITNQPASLAVPLGGNASFSVLAGGTGPLSYQWRLNGAAIPGATSSNYTRTNVQVADSGNYSVQVTNTAGQTVSSNALLTVVVPPVITNQPASLTVPLGSNASFTVLAGGSSPLSYQWRLNGTTIPGAISSNYTRTNVQVADSGNYSVQVTNTAGQTVSSNALLTVVVPPVITNQPASLTVPLGSNASFTVLAGGSSPLSYQWRLNGTAIPGATSSNYTRTNVQVADSGNYSVQISNAAAMVVSSNAVLTVPIAAVTGVLTSSTNPSLPGQAVTFALTLSAAPPASGIPIGTAQFRVDGTNAGSPATLVGGVAVLLTSSLAHGYRIVTANYTGDANFQGITNSLAPNQLVNTPPVAGAVNTQRVGTNGAQIAVSSLLTNASDADGDPINLVGVSSTSANGGTVLSNGDWIFYTPPSGNTNADNFNYVISDGFVNATAVVNVAWSQDNGPPPNLTIAAMGGGIYSIIGDGVPGRTYRIEFSDQLVTNWQNLGSSTADGSGVFRLNDTNGWPQRFYRSVYP